MIDEPTTDEATAADMEAGEVVTPPVLPGSPPRPRPRLALLALVAALAVALDQATKALVHAWLEIGESREVALGLRITRTENDGVSFSLGGGSQAPLIVLTLLVIVALVVYAARGGAHGRSGAVAFGLIVGGAIGNLIDRIVHGAVTDFVDLPRFWVFNVADICITVGVGLLILGALAPRRAAGA